MLVCQMYNNILIALAGSHAREWISPITSIYIIENVVEDILRDKNTSDYAKVNWLVIPVMNPDGYDYSFKTDRYWRKNRAPPSENSNCSGVNLNSNFGLPPPFENKGK